MESITLYEEFKLIERSENEINSVWKGAHLLLFFLAFVFGSFCTFCFHILMYLFDEKCVLFPKLLFITSLRQNIIYDFIPEEERMDTLPVDFLSTQWVDKSACYLPTYVPLVSGIFGLVWTTMFLMCSTGSRVLTGLQRPWRVLPPVFLFSLAMGGLCVYTSIVTHSGLKQLCHKLSEITGSTSCTFTVNVATLVYERRIRGVYQAIQLTILSAWLHTSCWLLSALLTAARVLLNVDFQLVRVKAQLRGDIDRMLEHYERQIGTVSPAIPPSEDHSDGDFKSDFNRKEPRTHKTNDGDFVRSEIIYSSKIIPESSELSLVPAEHIKLERLAALGGIPKKHRFIMKFLYEFLDSIHWPELPIYASSSASTTSTSSSKPTIVRQYGQQDITVKVEEQPSADDISDAEDVTKIVKSNLKGSDILKPSQGVPRFESAINIAFDHIQNYVNESLQNVKKDQATTSRATIFQTATSEATTSQATTQDMKPKKSNLKTVGVQTKQKGNVQIESRTDVVDVFSSVEDKKENKTTQTKKEKLD